MLTFSQTAPIACMPLCKPPLLLLVHSTAVYACWWVSWMLHALLTSGSTATAAINPALTLPAPFRSAAAVPQLLHTALACGHVVLQGRGPGLAPNTNMRWPGGHSAASETTASWHSRPWAPPGRPRANCLHQHVHLYVEIHVRHGKVRVCRSRRCMGRVCVLRCSGRVKWIHTQHGSTRQCAYAYRHTDECAGMRCTAIGHHRTPGHTTTRSGWAASLNMLCVFLSPGTQPSCSYK
jgi:hypothetical protein